MKGMKTRKLVFDPRTKLFMLLLCVIAASLAPSFVYGAGLVVLIGVMGILCGYWRSALTGIAGYASVPFAHTH